MESKFTSINNYAACMALALLATGCGDSFDQPPADSNIKPGSEVIFSSDAGLQSRSIYGEQGDDYFQIHWVEGDNINIQSKEAWVGTPDETKGPTEVDYAYYKVNKVEDFAYHGFISPFEESKTMLWSSEDAHTFYAAFPQCRNIAIKDGVFSMKYHTNQECASLKYDGNGNYTTSPDMRNAYMMAKNTAKAPEVSHVLLHFDPIMTTLDITVTAGQYEVGTGIIQPITVTGVSVIMPKYLKDGEFSYDMSGIGDTANGHADGWVLKSGTVVEGSESVFVGVVDDRDGSKKHYLDLFEGETLKLMAFLPPMEVDQYQIKVHTTSGYDFIKTVKKEDLSGAINKRSRINITLPNLYPDGSEYLGKDGTEAKSGNNWMSKLDDKTPLKHLSIPGFKCSKNTTAEQIEEMLNHGVRAFDVDELAKGLLKDIDDSIKQVFDNWINVHPTEFIFVWVEMPSGTPWNHNKKGWVDFGTDIASVQGKVIALAKIQSTSKIRNANKTASWDEDVFEYKNKQTGVGLSNTKWDCIYLNDVNNLTVFNNLFNKDTDSELLQTGFTGIVMIPDADKAYDSSTGKYTYSDLLIQGIIDCNYKFNLHK